MVIGILPVVGVPLPFISYGGTNFLIFSLAISITLICRSTIIVRALKVMLVSIATLSYCSANYDPAHRPDVAEFIEQTVQQTNFTKEQLTGI